MSWYGLVKYVHVLQAITAACSNLTYGIWQGAIVSRAPEHEGFALRTNKFIDDHVANPSYLLLLLTGLTLQAIGHWGLPRRQAIVWRPPRPRSTALRRCRSSSPLSS